MGKPPMKSSMKLVSTTVCGSSESTIVAMVLSVRDWVDAVVLLDTGVTDSTIHLARSVCDKVHVVPFTWINDFSAARNAALKAAHDVSLKEFGGVGGTWAVMVDTDETIRLIGSVDNLRDKLDKAGVDHLSIDHDSHIYSQPRFFRLPARGAFSGKTHEAYPAASLGCKYTSSAVFCDKPKSPEQLRVKLERDLVILQGEVLADPKASRWWYYLGDTLSNLGRSEGALDAFRQCWELNGWDEESAWAAYRCACLWADLEKWDRVVEWGVRGVQRHAGIAENAWQAAFGHHKAGNQRQAIYWAQLAVVHGYYEGDGKEIDRRGFKYLPALYEKPYDVLRYAYKFLGDETMEKLYARRAESARKKREVDTTQSPTTSLETTP